jgi:hypothetical protein
MEKPQDEKESLVHQSIVESVTAEKKADSNPTVTADEVPEHEYITGVKLWLVLAAVTLVVFLMMLDMSIIVTVSDILLPWRQMTNIVKRLFQELPVISTPYLTLGGMAAHIYSLGT